MKVKVWGTRGSVAAPGKETARYGGNTSCLEVVGRDGTVLVLDAGTGIRPLGLSLPPSLPRVDVLLSHLHLDHIQGLGFFAPLFEATKEVHLWGPASATQDLRTRLMRYLSAPLFPVPLRDLPCKLELHQVPNGTARIGEFEVDASLVCHPGPTVGYRIATAGKVLAYLPDHEPALGEHALRLPPDWTSGHAVARNADLLVHDAQYSDQEYAARVGWGHSSINHAIRFAALAQARHLLLFHHDPTHDDATLDRLLADTLDHARPPFAVTAAREGDVLELRA